MQSNVDTREMKDKGVIRISACMFMYGKSILMVKRGLHMNVAYKTPFGEAQFLCKAQLSIPPYFSRALCGDGVQVGKHHNVDNMGKSSVMMLCV